MIAGRDVTLKVPFSQLLRSCVHRGIVSCWPDAVFERSTPSHDDVLFEAFYFKNADAKEKINREGVPSKYSDLLIHILYGLESVTFVVASRATGQTGKMIDSLVKVIGNQPMCFGTRTTQNPTAVKRSLTELMAEITGYHSEVDCRAEKRRSRCSMCQALRRAKKALSGER